MPVNAPGPETPVFSPSEINREVRTHLEAGFARVWLRGEISNLARPASGHLYFSLKDSRSQLRCALFRGNAAGIGFRPGNGDDVLVRGRLSLYEPRGDYQLIADALLSAGAGALQQAFEALKKKLEAEGLFSSDRKKPLPTAPRRIGVVTSPSGAAVRDILDVLGQRWPLAKVRIYASQVQGDAAAPALRRALMAAERDQFSEVVLLARGGGSIEDLWAFNDEALARTLAAMTVPVVSGIGHETDFTIADFVSDLRAPTPTAAAVAATPDGSDFGKQFKKQTQRLESTLLRRIQTLSQGLDHLDRRRLSRHPNRLIAEASRRQMTASQQLSRSFQRSLRVRLQHLEGLDTRLRLAAPTRKTERLEQSVARLRTRLERAAGLRVEQHHSRLASLSRALNAVSPLKVLERGYAVVRDQEGQALTRAEQFQPDQSVKLSFSDFEVRARILEAPQQHYVSKARHSEPPSD